MAALGRQGRKDRTALPHAATLRYLDLMFAALKQAWKEAVENFRRELDPERYGQAFDHMNDAMRREFDTTRNSLRRVENDLAATHRDLDRELENEESCRRREKLARGINDLETARIAAEYAERHAERAAVLRRKADALSAERDLLRRDLNEMLATLDRLDPGTDQPAGQVGQDRFDPYTTAPDADGIEADFDRLEQEARERAAEARLNELKQKLS